MSSILISVALSTSVRAQDPVVDGYLDAGYGSALSTQTCNTSYGKATGGDSSGGSELDAAYGVVNAGDLYLFMAGNMQNNGNNVIIWIQGASGGQSTLNISSGWGASSMNGAKFSPGFAPNLMLTVDDSSGTLYADTFALSASGSVNTYIGDLAESSKGFADGSIAGIAIGLVNTNTAGVSNQAGTAANQANSAKVGVGLELGIPLSELGYTSGNIEVMAAIGNSTPNNLSNQFLPGLPSTYSSGPATNFNFSSTSGEFFTVVPEPSTICLVVLGLFGAIGLVRRHKA
ncbi:MAG: PEP-CTERM sorting domain-containing protein [Verrucomicrobiia bacterium]